MKSAKKIEKKVEKKLLKAEAPSKQKQKVKKLLHEGKPGEMILRQNKYFKTLADPFNHRGIQIPDLEMYPSTTFSIVDRRQITVNANGSCYVWYGGSGNTATLPLGGLVPVKVTSGGANNFIVGQTSNSAATAPYVPTTDIFPSGGATPNSSPFSLTQWSTGVTSIQSLFDKVRLVSAGTSVDYTGTDFDNAGTITSACLPRWSAIKNNIVNNVVTTIGFIQSLENSIIVPVNKNRGATVLYKPQDMRSLDYTNIQAVVSDASSGSLLAQQESMEGEMIHVITGATAGKVFQVTSVFNYEAIPLFNTVDLLQPETSKSDPFELSSAFNAMEAVAPQSIGTDQALGKTNPILTSGANISSVEHSVEPVDNSSMMEKIISSVESGVGFASDVAKKGTPLLEAALSFL